MDAPPQAEWIENDKTMSSIAGRTGSIGTLKAPVVDCATSGFAAVGLPTTATVTWPVRTGRTKILLIFFTFET
jgi:hypothetical protein